MNVLLRRLNSLNNEVGDKLLLANVVEFVRSEKTEGKVDTSTAGHNTELSETTAILVLKYLLASPDQQDSKVDQNKPIFLL